MENLNELTILIAEDDDGHAELIKQGLKKSGVCNKIIRFENGDKAWKFFKDKKRYNPNNSYLLLLDINMPLMDGAELLKKMKQDNTLKKIPIMILTTTDDPVEIDRCYQMGCNIYITKPVKFGDFSEKLKRLGLFIQIVSI